MQLDNQASKHRLELEEKLEQDIAALADLKEVEDSAKKLTNGMSAILTSIDDRLADLRKTILPVYSETNNLQKKQNNIEKTLSVLEHAISYYGVCREVESLVQSGPNNGGMKEFLEAMNKLHHAQRYFQKNNPSSVELENISTLFDTGLEALYTEFNNMLSRHSKPVLPIVLLDYIGMDDDTSNEDAPQSLCQLPENTLAELIKISEWLEEKSHHRHTKIYAIVRSQIVLKSLQLMKEHQRSASGGSTHASSPMLRTKFSHRHSINVPDSGRRTPRRLQLALEKKASKMLLKASQTTGLSFSTSRKQAQSPMGHHLGEDGAPDEQEMENYLLLAAGLHKLMQAEHSLIAKIWPQALRLQVLENTLKDAMDMVAQEGENIAARAKRCIAKRDFSAVLVVFPIIKHLEELKPDLERTVEGCETTLSSKFRSVIQTLTDTGAQALECFCENVRNESGSVLPKDGTVAESTSNVLVFLEQLTEYTNTAGAVLQRSNENDALRPKSSKELEKQHRSALGNYIKRVLALLNLVLVSKSDTCYSDPALRALFRLNNHNYIMQALKRSSLMDLLLLAESTAEKTYQDLLLRDKTNYVSTCLAKARSYIEQSNDDPGAKALKDRFSGFSREFEEAAKSQRTYSVPDARMRNLLRKELSQSIMAEYSSFYVKYRHVAFSKNPAKYIKFTPDQVAQSIESFFDTAA